MQFTTTTIALIASVMAGVSATPVKLAARQVCGSTPSASGSRSPLSQPTAATADACKAQCTANASCQSFVFGLPANANAPTCQLFDVPGAQIPAQGTNLVVFDKACTSVPTAAPTTANPTGANNGNAGNTGKPGNTVNPGNTNQGGQQNGQGGKQKARDTIAKRAVCGAAPTGPTSNNPSPLQTPTDITTQEACLARCKQTTGCQSIEFGKPSANEQAVCKLFNVPASQLPPRANGASTVAFDIAC